MVAFVNFLINELEMMMMMLWRNGELFGDHIQKNSAKLSVIVLLVCRGKSNNTSYNE